MKSILIAIPGADLIVPIFVIAALTLALPRTAQAFQETPGFVNITQSGVPVVDVRSTNGELYNDVANGGQIGTTVSGACNISKQGKDHPIKSLTISADGWPGKMSNADLGALPHNANDLPATG